MIVKMKKRKCFVCKKFLKKGDPTKKLARKDGTIITHYVGICYNCNCDVIIINRWKKKGIKAIDKQFKKLERIFHLLTKARFDLTQKSQKKK